MFLNHGTDFEAFFMDYGCWRWFTYDNWFSGCGMYNETGIEGSPSNTDLLNLNVSSNPIQTGDYIPFDLPTDGNASILIYDMSGRVAAKLIDDELQAGPHSIQFDGSNLSSGTYFIMLFANDQISTQKVLLTR